MTVSGHDARQRALNVHYANHDQKVMFDDCTRKECARFQIVDQPPPVGNDRTAIVDLVVADMEERKRIGIERYGVPLQAFNGRDGLVDAYQEALDLVMYLRQVIEEHPS